MSIDTLKQAVYDIVSVLPNRANDLTRLQTLTENDLPTITVVGKYNHGKSRLLNELIGLDCFAVADRRETVRLSDRKHRGVRWLDAPGLDADVGADDDRYAGRAAWMESDIRLFVHAAKEGELDAAELALLAELVVDDAKTRRQTIFVLSQIDQLVDDAELKAVARAIRAQVPGIEQFHVSAMRHRKGSEERKMRMLERSGIPTLRAELKEALGGVPRARMHETGLLVGGIREELTQLHASQEIVFCTLCEKQRRQRQVFDEGLGAVIDKVSKDILAMLSVHHGDDALIPDSAKHVYAVTAGKRERNRLQIGYSRACIEIDSFLIGHGVIALPAEQQTASRSINSVMIAVMGISVKLHKELRKMFGVDSGRDRMQREFTRYFELSADRRKLAAQIDSVKLALVATEKSLNALMAFEMSACV